MADVAHLASTALAVPLAYAFDRLSDPQALGRWALGSTGLTPTDLTGVFRGVSLFDGSAAIVEIVPHRALGLIDYHVGDMMARSPRVSIRLTSGAEWGQVAGTSMAALTTWRAAWMTDERWARTCTTHALEVLLFKSQIETDFRAGVAV